MKEILLIALFTLLLAGCDSQRDLYDTASPLLYIEGDWVPSLGIQNMSNKATAMLYKKGDGITKEFFLQPNNVTPKVSRGEYDILIFNGLMFSEENTNLDHIAFRNTNNVEDFEAFVLDVAPNSRLVRADGEYIASNEMERLTSIRHKTFVESEHYYYIKYQNGHKVQTTEGDYIEQEIRLVPYAHSYLAQVTIHLINPSSAAVANGSLRGFIGSIFMASGKPSHFDVTHQLRLNNLRITNHGTKGDPNDPETGTIESPLFVTFGPPIDLPDRRYTFELSIIIKDGTELNQTFDITDQVAPVVIERFNFLQTHNSPINLTIPIEISFELPFVDPESVITVNDWGDEEIIRVPI